MGFPLKTVLLRLVQGFIIGAGGILPGISGGVLSVIFGIYRPVMEVLAHPLDGLRRHLSLLLPVGAGAILGFLCGGGLILVLFDRSEKLATCLFIGLILGTLPSLWAEAGAQGRGRGAYLSCAASFLALSAVLLYAQYGAFYTMRPGFLGFLFCGLLWGLSLIVPGMTSSSILMAVGLFTPMAEGFARLDMAVILPWLLGMALIVLTLARVVNWCFRAHYPLFYHAVFGIVLASTVVIIPLHYDGARDALLCLLAAALGAAAIEGGTMTEFERECDNAVNRYMTGAHLKSFGPEQVVGYLTAEEGNTMAVRMVLTGLLAGIDPERLKERLRESYV